MKHIRTLVAVPALTCGVVLAGTTQASAREIDPEEADRPNVVVGHEPTIPGDDTVAEALQTGAGAIGGAAIALTVLWAHRRRHLLRTQ